MRVRVVAVLIGVATLLTASGCVLPGAVTDGFVESIRRIDGGECFPRDRNGAVDLTRAVPCTQDHAFEVIGVHGLPEGMEGVAFGDVLNDEGLLDEALLEYGIDACLPAYLEQSGVADSIGAVPEYQGDVGLWPGTPGNLMISTTPENVWPRYSALLCLYEALDHAGAPAVIRSTTPAPAVTSFGTAEAAADLRVCQTMSGPKQLYQAVPCDEPHGSETLFIFDAALMYGAPWVATVDPLAVTEKQWAQLDATCLAAWEAVFGTDRRAEDVGLMAEILPGAWGVTGTGQGDHAVLCLALPMEEGMLLDGPVWGLGDDPAALVPAER